MKDIGVIRAFLLVAGFLVLWWAIGCGAEDQSLNRFRCIERVNRGSLLYEDTETGDVWVYCSKGCMASDTWTKVESGQSGEAMESTE